MYRYFIVYKPYQVLSQFSPLSGKSTLADYFKVPKDVYPVGRLDYDSEGLLILTNDTQLNHRLLTPAFRHEREYWAQVEGIIHAEALHELQRGVTISIDGKMHTTLPCKVNIFKESPYLPERNPPIRCRKDIPVSWVSLCLTEGKNRQVRRMTAKVGFPTLRLLRVRIERLTLDDMRAGDLRELSKKEMYDGLFS